MFLHSSLPLNEIHETDKSLERRVSNGEQMRQWHHLVLVSKEAGIDCAKVTPSLLPLFITGWK